MRLSIFTVALAGLFFVGGCGVLQTTGEGGEASVEASEGVLWGKAVGADSLQGASVSDVAEAVGADSLQGASVSDVAEAVGVDSLQGASVSESGLAGECDDSEVGKDMSQADVGDEGAQSFVDCEVRIDHESELYTAQATGPTLEEARDNAVEEACAVSCADRVGGASEGVSEDEIERRIDVCSDGCVSQAIVIAGVCTQDGGVIYTEGAWNENGDGAPTNGAESAE